MRMSPAEAADGVRRHAHLACLWCLSGGFCILLAMEATLVETVREGSVVGSPADLAAALGARDAATQERVDELAGLSAHLSAATARWLEVVWEMHVENDSSDLRAFMAWRCGITGREAREFLRVAEALQGLPLIRASFGRGELTFTKVRALTRVATAVSEEGLLDLAGALSASQLERALRVFRRVAVEDARHAQELEYVDYYLDDDGTLFLRARLAAEDGVLVIRALEAARERVVSRRHEERAAGAAGDPPEEKHVDAPAQTEIGTDPTEMVPDHAQGWEPAVMESAGHPRPARVEALLDLAEASLALECESGRERARVVVHIDAAALTTDSGGRCELEDGPLISLETARRLGCDADVAAQLERDGLPVSVGRSRRTVPPALRRLLEARDDSTCCVSLAVSAAVICRRIIVSTGPMGVRRASRTSSCSVISITVWCTRAATPSKGTPRAAFASGTAMGSSGRSRHPGHPPGARTT